MTLSTHRLQSARSFLLVLCMGLLASVSPQVSAAQGKALGRENEWATSPPDSARPSLAAWSFTDSRVEIGSASLVSPAAILVNRSLSTLVYMTSERRLGRVDWGAGWTSVRDALTHPGAAVNRAGGLGTWLKHEFGPTGYDVWAWAWAANYGGHVLAGGITYRLMSDWFAQRGVPKPRVAGALFTWGAGLVDEVLENQQWTRGMATTVADAYIFEPLGILLFSFDGVARFAATTLQAADWSPQGSITLPDGAVRNNDQMMSYKVPLPFTDRARVLFLMGQQSSSSGWRSGPRAGSISPGTTPCWPAALPPWAINCWR